MSTSQRNNNKAFPNSYVDMFDDISTTYPTFFCCHSCKILYNDSSGGAHLRMFNHLKNDHGYVDSG